MLAVNQILCVMLMSCFDKELINYDKCPRNCKCFTAPKDGYDYKMQSKSLICDNINDLSDNQLKALEPINTLAVGIKMDIRTDTVNILSDDNFYINHLYFYGIPTETKTTLRTVNSMSPLIGVDPNALEAITLVDLNLDTFNWKSLTQQKQLKNIYIKNCELNKIDQDGFGLLSSLKIISVSIINSKLKDIHKNTFIGWNELKMISIVGNPLKDMNWLKTNLPNLWNVNLKNNYIWQIPDGLQSYLPSLKVLNLNENNLKVLYWQIIQPLLPILREFSLNDNTLCMNEDVEEFYKELGNYQGKVPAFFLWSMQKQLYCVDISDYSANTSAPLTPYLCSDYKKYGYKHLPDFHIRCINWPGDKK